MKWFKFLIYFGLFAGAVMSALNGYLLLTGGHYQGQAELVYRYFGDLKTLDLFIGLASLVSAGVLVYARFQLSGFRKNGPVALMITYGLSAAVNLIYVIGANSILSDAAGVSLDMSSTIASVITSVAMIFVNKAYFDKRSHLFVN